MFFRKKETRSLELDQLKQLARVLIIDDEKPRELISFLKKEGWVVKYLSELDCLTNEILLESQIICLDIMGVGQELGEDDGMGIVGPIKRRYPEKKIILYSSKSKQDIFSEAVDLVDKRLRKETSLVPFSSAIEELSAKTFSWNEVLDYTYEKMNENFSDNIDLSEFKKIMGKTAIERAAKTLSNMDWFEVIDTRGHIQDGKIAHYQVTLKVGFRLD